MANEEYKSARTLNWITDIDFQGWACSRCGWNYPMPTLLGDPEAKTAYDRLAAGKFRDHDCESHPPRSKSSDSVNFSSRIRSLVSQGFKPKDAVELMLQEVAFESRNDDKVMALARAESEDFLRRMREGLL